MTHHNFIRKLAFEAEAEDEAEAAERDSPLSWGKSLSLLHLFLIKKKANSINEEIPR